MAANSLILSLEKHRAAEEKRLMGPHHILLPYIGAFNHLTKEDQQDSLDVDVVTEEDDGCEHDKMESQETEYPWLSPIHLSVYHTK